MLLKALARSRVTRLWDWCTLRVVRMILCMSSAPSLRSANWVRWLVVWYSFIATALMALVKVRRRHRPIAMGRMPEGCLASGSSLALSSRVRDWGPVEPLKIADKKECKSSGGVESLGKGQEILESTAI